MMNGNSLTDCYPYLIVGISITEVPVGGAGDLFKDLELSGCEVSAPLGFVFDVVIAFKAHGVAHEVQVGAAELEGSPAGS